MTRPRSEPETLTLETVLKQLEHRYLSTVRREPFVEWLAPKLEAARRAQHEFGRISPKQNPDGSNPMDDLTPFLTALRDEWRRTCGELADQDEHKRFQRTQAAQQAGSDVPETLTVTVDELAAALEQDTSDPRNHARHYDSLAEMCEAESRRLFDLIAIIHRQRAAALDAPEGS